MLARLAAMTIVTATLAGAAACGSDAIESPTSRPRQPHTPAPTSACLKASSAQTGPDDFNAKVTFTSQPNGLKYGDFKVGTGPNPAIGQKVVVQYTGWLKDGTKFDSSRDRSTPFDFKIGLSEVINGWDDGVSTMRVGGKRRLVVPPTLAYGPGGSPPKIPGNATLTFDVELLSVGC